MSVGLLESPAVNVQLPVYSPVGLVDVPSGGRLQSSIEDIAERLYQQLDDIAVQVTCAPTIKDFVALRERLLPSYIKLSMAFSNVVLAKLDEAELPGMIHTSFAALESEFATKAPSYFGDDAFQEIMFSLSTLKSAYRWLPHIVSLSVDDNDRQKDSELGRDFASASVWANFHFLALRSALRKNQTIIPDVLQELLDGLRLSVMVYAYVRQALDLRNILADRYSEDLNVSWDDEDEALANAD